MNDASQKCHEYPKYYFAYGSNLDAERFGRRIGRAIQEDEMSPGVLTKYELVLNKEGSCEKCKKRGVAKANVVENSDSVVEGIVYEIKNFEEQEKLRGYEGYPVEYEEENLSIQTKDENKKCFVYIAQECKSGLPAENHYIDYICKGESVFSENYYAAIKKLFANTERHQCDANPKYK